MASERATVASRLLAQMLVADNYEPKLRDADMEECGDGNYCKCPGGYLQLYNAAPASRSDGKRYKVLESYDFRLVCESVRLADMLLDYLENTERTHDKDALQGTGGTSGEDRRPHRRERQTAGAGG